MFNLNGGLSKPPLNFRQWMSNYTTPFYVDVITYPCPYPDTGVAPSNQGESENLQSSQVFQDITNFKFFFLKVPHGE